MNWFKKEMLIKSILILFLLLGFIFRYNGLRNNYSFWTDEASTARFARGVLQTGVSQIPATGHKESSYYVTVYLTAFSMRLFGENEFGARLPQLIAGTVLIFVIYLLGKEMFNRTIGLGASFLTTFSYLMIVWSRQARGYSLLVLFFILALLFLYRYSLTGKLLNLIFFIINLFLCILTHTLGIVLIPISIFYLGLSGNLKNFFTKKMIFAVALSTVLLFYFTNLFPVVKLLVNEKLSRIFLQREFYLSYFHSLFWRQYSLVSFFSIFSLATIFLRKDIQQKKQFLLMVSALSVYLFSASFLLYVPFEKYVLPQFPFVLF
jgi:4-amino-4-deoxy-L-arabinose transferase-like glycosyltransferase